MKEDAKISVGRRRLRGFVIHLAAYFVGWGSVLALHVAYVMGLFDTIKNDDR
jgi:hypothetical protein